MEILNKHKNLLEVLFTEENDYMVNIFQGGEIVYPFGFLFGKLSERDSRIINLLNEIKFFLNTDDSFKKFIVNLEKSSKIKEQNSLIKKIQEYEKIGVRDHVSMVQLEHITTILNHISYDYIERYYGAIYEGLNNETNILNCSKEEYILLNFLKLLYEYWQSTTRRFHIPKNNRLEELYKQKGINLNEIDLQYKKYKLLTVDDNVNICDSNIPKIYDRRIGTYILINEVDHRLLSCFKNLISLGYIKSLALRPDYYVVGEDFIDLSIALEEIERGDIFSFEGLGIPSISKLYNANYDNLWIVQDNANITFEEILNNFDIYDDLIVTQVLHLEYHIDANNALIRHLDHEYIFYTIDEFDQRRLDYTQKGSGKKRFKTFKIDRSSIPFEVNNEFLIYNVLARYFKNIDLLKEYFANVLKT